MKQKIKTNELVALTKISIDPQYRVRDRLNESTITKLYEHYREDPDRLPPIKVLRKGNRLYVLDGLHRLEAAKKAGLKDIWCTILDGDEKAGLWHAIGSNKHGRRMTKADQKNAVNSALDFFPDKNLAEIASQIGCTENFVRQIKRERVDHLLSTIFAEQCDILRDKFWTACGPVSDKKIRRFGQDIQVLLGIDDET